MWSAAAAASKLSRNWRQSICQSVSSIGRSGESDSLSTIGNWTLCDQASLSATNQILLSRWGTAASIDRSTRSTLQTHLIDFHMFVFIPISICHLLCAYLLPFLHYFTLCLKRTTDRLTSTSSSSENGLCSGFILLRDENIVQIDT